LGNNIKLERYWPEILSVINDGLMLVAPDGTIIMTNRAFEDLTGFSSREVRGQPCTVLNCDGCDKALSKGGRAWCSLFEDPRRVKKRCIITRKDGTYLTVLKTASVLRDDKGNAIAAIETFMDTSEYEKASRQISDLSRRLEEETGFMGIIGRSESMQRVFTLMEKASLSDAPVIIQGESGTGKELVAMGIHQLGRRKEGPFVKLNCAALNEALLESELFGHSKGAFTGAYRHRIGRFEAANGGDIFLDEIGDIPLSIQVKLLRVLETKQLERVGENISISVDVRIITATNQDLSRLLGEKRFREDLFFRINVIPINLPPLRERKEDIPLLIAEFIKRLNRMSGKDIKGLSHGAMELLMRYRWPGNVRELKSALEYAFVVAEGPLLDIGHLPSTLSEGRDIGLRVRSPKRPDPSLEKQALIEALGKSKGNQSEAARLLGVSRVTVWHRMRKHGIEIDRKLVG
jgi:PAS domain S-box-containing protein